MKLQRKSPLNYALATWIGAEKTFDEKQKLLDADFIKKLQVAESAVKYLRRFTDHQLYQNQGRRVRRVLKAPVKSKLAK